MSIPVSTSGIAIAASAGIAVFGGTIDDALGNVTIVEYGAGERVDPYGAFFVAESLDVDGITQNLSSGYDESFNSVDYIWTVDDDPIAAPPAFLNIPTAWKDHNFAFGQQCSFVFPAGSHTVRLRVYERGTRTLLAEDTHSVVVSDPDDVYTGDRTLLFSDSGDFSGISGELTNADQASTEAGIETWLDNLTTTGRILFRTNENHTISQISLEPSASGNCRVGISSAFGGAGRATVTTSSANVFSCSAADGARDFTFYGIDFVASSKFSSGGATAWPWAFGSSVSSSASAIPMFCVHDCTQDGFNGGSSVSGHNWIIFNDYHYDEWDTYGMYMQATDSGYSRLGLNAVQFTPPGASGDTTTTYGCLRSPRAENFSFRMCNFTGSSASSSSYSQSPLRMAADASGVSRFTIERCVVENNPDQQANAPINVNDTSNQNYDGPFGALIHNTLIINEAGFTTTGVGARNAGIRVSNCAYLWNGPVEDGILGMVERAHTTQELDYPVECYNCGNFSSAGTISGWDLNFADNVGSAGYTNITDENNVSHVTGADDSPLDESTALAGFTPFFGLDMYTFEPQTGSSAKDAATSGLRAYDSADAPGTARGTPNDAGWWQS